MLASRPRNRQALEEAGRGFGRIAHLLDAAEDLTADAAAGRYNPLLATGTSVAEARAHCDRSLDVVRAAVAELDLAERALTEALLVSEVGIAIDRVFAGTGGGTAGPPRTGRPGPLRLLDLPCQAGWKVPACRSWDPPGDGTRPGQWPGDPAAGGQPLPGWQQDPVPGPGYQPPGPPPPAGRRRLGCCTDCCTDGACEACSEGADCCSACDCSC